MNNKLNIKDFMTIAIFTVINLVLGMIIAAPLGGTPFTYMLICPVNALIGGIPTILFYSKVKKFGMLLIQSIIIGIFGLVLGFGIYALLLGVVCALISEAVLKSGEYKSMPKFILAYAFNCIAGISNYIPIFIASKKYFDKIGKQYGESFLNGLKEYSQNKLLLLALIAVAFVPGLLGGLLGKLVFRRHFERSGII